MFRAINIYNGVKYIYRCITLQNYKQYFNLIDM